MPEKWPGLSAAVRMVMAPPCDENGQHVGAGVASVSS